MKRSQISNRFNIDGLIIRAPYHCYTEDRTNELFIQLEEGEVLLWNYDATITWTMKSPSFPSQGHVEYAKEQTQQAIMEWGIKGVEFKYVDEKEIDNATFVVKYSKSPSGGTIAKAFFPVEDQENIVIYPLAFTEGEIKYLKNNLSHEIGHIYGLRHEFAIREADPSVQFGPSNPASVMNYNSPPVIQDSDRTWLQKLYDRSQNITFIGSEKFPVRRLAPFNGN